MKLNCFCGVDQIEGVSAVNHFVAPSDMMEAAQYAEDNFTKPWIVGLRMSLFANERDAALFKLRWG